MRGDSGGYWARVILLFLVYFVTARIGLTLDAVGGFATTVWPPTGIAVAALLILGQRYWPGVAAGAFLVNSVTGAALLVAVGISAGNTLEALMATYLIKRFMRLNFSLESVRDVLGLIFFAALISPLVSATIGVSSLLLGNTIDASAFRETWAAWWIGDTLGALVVAPLVLVWSTRLHRLVEINRLKRAALPFAFLATASVLIFFGPWYGLKPFSLAYAVYPVLLWIVLKHSQRGSVTAIFLVSVIAIGGTVATHASGAGMSLSQRLFLLQSFIGITAATFMLMAAVVSEREKTLGEQQRLIQKTAALTRQRYRLQALNDAKDEFISIASHQLRTPATSVKQYIGMLLESYAGNLSPEQYAYAERAYHSNERQLKIITDLLDIARLDAGKVQLKKTRCDITKLINDVVEQQHQVFKKRRQKLIFSPETRRVIVAADKELLRMVIENILDNASKYSPASKNVTVTLTRLNNRIQLAVTDAGIGIAKKDQKKLFQKFSRVGSDVDGSGLGLYWAKRIVDLHGGSITLSSELRKGSTFTVTLPIKSSPRLTAQA